MANVITYFIDIGTSVYGTYPTASSSTKIYAEDYTGLSFNNYTIPNTYIHTSTYGTNYNNEIEKRVQKSIQEMQAEEDARIFRNIDFKPWHFTATINKTYNTGETLDCIGGSIQVGNLVETPKGKGLVYLIDEDVYCIELDPTSNILHEFTIDEIKKI